MSASNEDLAARHARKTVYAAVTCYMSGDHPQTCKIVQELLRDPMLAGLGMVALIDAVTVMTTTLAEELSLDPRKLWSETLRQDALEEATRDAAQ